MSNRLKMVQKEVLQQLFRSGWSDRKIKKATGIHRLTVARYRREWEASQGDCDGQDAGGESPVATAGGFHDIVQSVPPPEKKCPPEGVVHFPQAATMREVPTDRLKMHFDPKPESHSFSTVSQRSQASGHHEQISEKLRLGQSARSIYQDLVMECAYTGSYDSVKRYVRKLRQRTPKLYARIETDAGEEAQVDFGQGAPTLRNGRYHTPWLFVMTLSHSRKSYQEAVWRQDVETFLGCHENAFRFFSGVTRTVKVDNLKSAVLEAHLYEPTLNPNYVALGEHYGFIPLPCPSGPGLDGRVRTPQHKGKVESGVKYVQNNALKGKRFEFLEQQNQYLRKWNRTWASTRIHGTRKQQVEKMFIEEKPHLLPLPEKSFEYFRLGTRKVNALDSHIEVEGAFYPVPPRYMGQGVHVHYNSKCVKVYYQEQLIQHLSRVGKGCFHPDKSCLPAQKSWKQEQYFRYLLKQCRQIGPAVLAWAQACYARRSYSALRSIQGVVALGRKYPNQVINQACRQALDHNGFNYHHIKELAEAIRLQKKVQREIRFTQKDELIRSPREYHRLLNGEE